MDGKQNTNMTHLAADRSQDLDPTKRAHGRYYTVGDPFSAHPAFNRFVARLPAGACILEPCVGQGHLVNHLRRNGVNNVVQGFDIKPAVTEIEGRQVICQDTLADFPQGYDVVAMNPPFLSRSSATRMGIPFPEDEEARDLYEVALKKALAASSFIIAVIPASFICSPRFRDRLEAVVELPADLFVDTQHPTCLALFGDVATDDYEVWQGDRLIGMASAIAKCAPSVKPQTAWSFNDPKGSIGLQALDDSSGASIAFVKGEVIAAEKVKKTSKSLTRISGLPAGIDAAMVVERANALLQAWRRETGGILICPFKANRRRLAFGTAKQFLDAALMSLAANDDRYRLAA